MKFKIANVSFKCIVSSDVLPVSGTICNIKGERYNLVVINSDLEGEEQYIFSAYLYILDGNKVLEESSKTKVFVQNGHKYILFNTSVFISEDKQPGENLHIYPALVRHDGKDVIPLDYSTEEFAYVNKGLSSTPVIKDIEVEKYVLSGNKVPFSPEDIEHESEDTDEYLEDIDSELGENEIDLTQ